MKLHIIITKLWGYPLIQLLLAHHFELIISLSLILTEKSDKYKANIGLEFIRQPDEQLQIDASIVLFLPTVKYTLGGCHSNFMARQHETVTL